MVNFKEIVQLPALQGSEITSDLVMPVQDDGIADTKPAKKMGLAELAEWLGLLPQDGKLTNVMDIQPVAGSTGRFMVTYRDGSTLEIAMPSGGGGGEAGDWLPNTTMNKEESIGVTDEASVSMTNNARIDMKGVSKIQMAENATLSMDGPHARLSVENALVHFLRELEGVFENIPKMTHPSGYMVFLRDDGLTGNILSLDLCSGRIYTIMIKRNYDYGKYYNLNTWQRIAEYSDIVEGGGEGGGGGGGPAGSWLPNETDNPESTGVTTGSSIKVESSSRLNLSGGCILDLHDSGTVSVHNSGNLHVHNGGKVEVQHNGEINLHDSGKIKIWESAGIDLSGQAKIIGSSIGAVCGLQGYFAIENQIVRSGRLYAMSADMNIGMGVSKEIADSFIIGDVFYFYTSSGESRSLKYSDAFGSGRTETVPFEECVSLILISKTFIPNSDSISLRFRSLGRMGPQGEQGPQGPPGTAGGGGSGNPVFVSDYTVSDYRHLVRIAVTSNANANNFNGIMNLYSKANNSPTYIVGSIFIAIPNVFNTFNIDAKWMGLVNPGTASSAELYYQLSGSAGTGVTYIDFYLKRIPSGSVYAATIEVLANSVGVGSVSIPSTRPTPTVQSLVLIPQIGREKTQTMSLGTIPNTTESRCKFKIVNGIAYLNIDFTNGYYLAPDTLLFDFTASVPPPNGMMLMLFVMTGDGNYGSALCKFEVTGNRVNGILKSSIATGTVVSGFAAWPEF